MPRRFDVPLRGLYAIADSGLIPDHDLEARVTAALQGGACLLQYRDKRTDTSHRVGNVRLLRDLCRHHHALLLINDDVQLARETGADGVHLGRDDMDAGRARDILGEHAIIGVSCYNEYSRAEAARREGADYVAFGRFYPSATKPEAIQAEVELLHHARRLLDLPICAIGGITVDNGARLIEAGADMLAVVGGVFAEPDVRLAAERFSRLFPASAHPIVL